MKNRIFPIIFTGLILAIPLNAETVISTPNKVEVVKPTTVVTPKHQDPKVVTPVDEVVTPHVVVPKLLANHDPVVVPNKDGTVVPHKDVPVVPDKKGVDSHLVAVADPVVVPNKDGTVVPHKDVPVVPDKKGVDAHLVAVVTVDKDSGVVPPVAAPEKDAKDVAPVKDGAVAPAKDAVVVPEKKVDVPVNQNAGGCK